jgi:hypothetical protein
MFFHTTPSGVVRGEEAKIEVMIPGVGSEIYDFYLFYRELGESEYKSLPMTNQGLLFYANVKTGQFTTNQMQYYIAYETSLGQIGTLPEEMAELNPYTMEIVPAPNLQTDGPVEVVILSPLPEDVVSQEDFLIAVSMYSEKEKIEYSNTKLIVDGVNIRNNIDFADGVVTFAPPPGYKMRGGFHNVEIQVFNAAGVMLGKREWSFRSTQSASPRTNSFFRGSAFIENRYQNIATFSDNFFRAGAEVSGKYNDLDYRARLVFSSEEDPERQPVNRYGAKLQYNFSADNNIYLYGGDFNPYFNPLVLSDKRVRGIQTGLSFGFFTFDYILGELRRGINGRIDTLNTGGNMQLIPVGGVYQQNMWAIRPGFKFGDNVWWTLNLVNVKEDSNSINIGSNVRESVSIGSDLNMNFDNRRIILDASFNSSINNSNASLQTISWDTLVQHNEDLKGNDGAKQAWDFLESTGWLSMTTGLNPLPSYAMRFDAAFRYFNNNLKFQYYSIDQNFANPGNPYLLKDVSGLHISDNIRLVDNQVFLTLFYKNYTTNKSLDTESTSNNELGAAISYFPFASLPSLTVSYSNMERSNTVSESDSLLYRLDNSTHRLAFNTSYKMQLSGTDNTLMLNYTNYGRDDRIYPTAQSDFNLYGIGVRTTFNFPLTTRINYSNSENDIGRDVSSNRSTTTVSTLRAGLDYITPGFLSNDIFKPFFDYRWQNVTTDRNSGGMPTSFETSRNNFTIGLAYQSPMLGILSLRYDHISYGNEEIDFDDSILNFRYTYSF